jgi:hypothetical protein
MDLLADRDADEDIAELEARIEALAGRLENCRKIALAAQIAFGAGIVVLIAVLIGIMRADALPTIGALVAILGSVVLYGSNRSTAAELAAEIGAAEQARGRLIASLTLHAPGGSHTLH